MKNNYLASKHLGYTLHHYWIMDFTIQLCTRFTFIFGEQSRRWNECVFPVGKIEATTYRKIGFLRHGFVYREVKS